MRKQRSVSLVIGLLCTASFGAAQQWVVTRTKADIEAEVRATQVSVSLEKTSIVAGESLVLPVTIQNEGDTDKWRCMDKTCLAWTVRTAKYGRVEYLNTTVCSNTIEVMAAG